MSMPQATSAFEAHPELVAKLDKQARPVALRPDRLLFRRGDMPLGVYILKKGKARLTSQSDGDAIQAIHAGPGSLFGLSAVIEAKPYSLTAEAMEGAELSLLTCEDFLHLMQIEPSLSFRALKVLAQEVRFARETLSHL
jgi:CRP-like cAMP-binding protein